MTHRLTVLGVESSCDDSGAAVVELSSEGAVIKSNIVRSQATLHEAFGGVVPEIAARAHVEVLDHCVEEALASAGVGLPDVDVIAVTSGPGLIGGVVSGVMTAKGLAAGAGKPLVGVNHLAGHALTPCLTDCVAFPFLLLLVSGGHCQFLIVRGIADFTRLGGTIDDAPGEAFDKVAKLLALPQPGGPAIEALAKSGEPTIPLPRPLLDRPGCDLSFSGLKTAVLRARDDRTVDGRLSAQDQASLAASFQAAVVDVLAEKSRRAIAAYRSEIGSGGTFAVAGGVAANGPLRAALQDLCAAEGLDFVAPPLALCTDNAAMIAYAGGAQYAEGHVDDLTLSARPRWPLDQSQPSMLGSGKKGAKA